MAQVTNDETWQSTQKTFPIGATVRGHVIWKFPFGVRIGVEGHPDATVMVDTISYRPEGAPVPPEELPDVGEEVVGKVVDHAQHNRQIKLRVEPLA